MCPYLISHMVSVDVKHHDRRMSLRSDSLPHSLGLTGGSTASVEY